METPSRIPTKRPSHDTPRAYTLSCYYSKYVPSSVAQVSHLTDVGKQTKRRPPVGEAGPVGEVSQEEVSGGRGREVGVQTWTLRVLVGAERVLAQGQEDGPQGRCEGSCVLEVTLEGEEEVSQKGVEVGTMERAPVVQKEGEVFFILELR